MQMHTLGVAQQRPTLNSIINVWYLKILVNPNYFTYNIGNILHIHSFKSSDSQLIYSLDVRRCSLDCFMWAEKKKISSLSEWWWILTRVCLCIYHTVSICMLRKNVPSSPSHLCHYLLESESNRENLCNLAKAYLNAKLNAKNVLQRSVSKTITQCRIIFPLIQHFEPHDQLKGQWHLFSHSIPSSYRSGYF